MRLVEAAVLTLILGLSLVGIPAAPDANLDASWQVMLIRAHDQGLQFGRDVIFTWGPWGFLCSRYHLGNLQAVPILVWGIGGQFLMALALVVLTRSLPAWRRFAFVAALLAFHWLFLDVVYFVLIALIGIAGLMRRDAGVLRLVAWTLVLGFLSQLKFTYLVISIGRRPFGDGVLGRPSKLGQVPGDPAGLRLRRLRRLGCGGAGPGQPLSLLAAKHRDRLGLRRRHGHGRVMAALLLGRGRRAGVRLRRRPGVAGGARAGVRLRGVRLPCPCVPADVEGRASRGRTSYRWACPRKSRHANEAERESTVLT